MTQHRWIPLLALSATLTGCGTAGVSGIAAPETTATPTAPPTTSYALSTLVTPSPTTTTVPPAPPPAITPPPATVPRPTPAPSPKAADPAGVVGAFFAAINAKDYRRAWDLGGRNLEASYDAFAKGFANTAHVDLTVAGVAGPTVTTQLHATNADGGQQDFKGTYTVVNGLVTAGSQVPVP